MQMPEIQRTKRIKFNQTFSMDYKTIDVREVVKAPNANAINEEAND